MATRMQQRRGTALQWTTADPILNVGEIGYETDTNKFKIGDGASDWSELQYFTDAGASGGSLEDYVPLTQKGAISGVAALDASKNVVVPGASIIVEGATDNEFETTLTVTNPTADRTITFPDVAGTVITTGNLSDITNIGVFTSTITMEGSTANDFELTLSAGDPTADRTLTFPDATDTLVGRATTDTLTNKTIDIASNTLTGVAALSGATFTGAVSGTDLTLSGNLTVNGTTTNINSTNLVVEDKNIVLADVTTPTDTTADGGGITLKGATDKTLNWVDATDAWTSSEDFNLLTGKVYEIAGTSVLSGTTLGSGVTGSSLTSVGTITSGTWTGTAIAIANGGTGQTTAMTAATALLPSQTSNSGKYLTNDGSGTLSWGTVTGYSAPTLGSTSIASGATVTTIDGLTDIVLNGPGSVTDELTLLLMGAL